MIERFPQTGEPNGVTEPEPTTPAQAEENGYTDGYTDGYAGNADDPYAEGDKLPPELRAHYRTGYREGYKDGQASYRRTVE